MRVVKVDEGRADYAGALMMSVGCVFHIQDGTKGCQGCPKGKKCIMVGVQ